MGLTKKSYSLEHHANEIKFWCNNDKIVKDVYDYIKRYIDADNYRGLMQECHKVEWQLDESGWLTKEVD